jgi:hypothetical protein
MLERPPHGGTGRPRPNRAVLVVSRAAADCVPMPPAKADGTPDRRYSGSNGDGGVGGGSGGGDARPTKRRSRSPARQPPIAASPSLPHLAPPAAPLEPARSSILQRATSHLLKQAPRASMPLLDRSRLTLCAAAVLGCLLLYAFGDLLGATLYEAMGSSLVCATVPVAYTRMMVGGERLMVRASHAACLALLSLWLFSSPAGARPTATLTLTLTLTLTQTQPQPQPKP